MNLEKMGWNDYFEGLFRDFEDKGLIPARVVMQQKNSYVLYCEEAVLDAQLSGAFRHRVMMKKDFPVVGDWVAAKVIENHGQALIHAVLERRNSFSRKTPISGGRKIKNGIISGGSPEEQVAAANIDTAFIVCGLDENFNIRRIERYITLCYNSGVSPVILLNKMDLCDNVHEYLRQVYDVAIGIEVHPVSAMRGMGLESLNKYLLPGRTVVFFGSSGVGKSTIINRLIGEERQSIRSVSDSTGKGRHTTTHRELFFHESGAMIIDTPGLRELQLWGNEDGVHDSFRDIVNISSRCKFIDCSHGNEPGCAVKQAIHNRTLSIERFESYKKQLDELHRLSKEHRKFNIHGSRMRKKMGL